MKKRRLKTILGLLLMAAGCSDPMVQLPEAGLDGSVDRPTEIEVDLGSDQDAIDILVDLGSDESVAIPPGIHYLKASNPDRLDNFGTSTSLYGDTLAVGAPYESSSATGVNSTNQDDNTSPSSGAVYLFARSGSTWSQQAYIKASNTGIIHRFGTAVALYGDTLAVGAPYESSKATGVNSPNQDDDTSPSSGAVYIFTRSGDTWSQQAYIKASNTGAFDQFGSSVSLFGDTLAVGAIGEASGAIGVNSSNQGDGFRDSGAVYVFTREAGTWSQQAYLKASNTGAGDFFGSSVALSGDTLAVGAHDEDSSATGVNQPDQGDDPDFTNSGAVYVFTRGGGTWSQQAFLKSSNTSAGDSFGSSVALSGETLAVSALLEKSGGSDPNIPIPGAVYIFNRTGGTWSQQAHLTPNTSDTFFGWSIALSEETLAVGAIWDPNSGAVYLFTRSNSVWAPQPSLKAHNPTVGAAFGSAVSLDRGTLAVGANFDSSSATGVDDPTQGDNPNYLHSGAAYVYPIP